MNIKHLTTISIAALVLTLGCKKAMKPQMRGNHSETEVMTTGSIVPFGDEERIIIKPRVTLSTGAVAVGARVTVSQNSFTTFGIVNSTNTLSIEVPSLGDFEYDIDYEGSHVVDDHVLVDAPVVVHHDIID